MNPSTRHSHSENLAGIFRTLEALTVLGNRIDHVKNDENWIALTAPDVSNETPHLSARIQPLRFDKNTHLEVNVFIDALPVNFYTRDVLKMISVEDAKAIEALASQKVTSELCASSMVRDADYLAALLVDLASSKEQDSSVSGFISKFDDFLSLNKTLNRLQILQGLGHAITHLPLEGSEKTARRLMIMILMVSNGEGPLLVNCITFMTQQSNATESYVLELTKRLLQQDSSRIDDHITQEIWSTFFSRLDSISPNYIDLIQYAPEPIGSSTKYEFPLEASHLLQHAQKQYLSGYQDKFEDLFERSVLRLESETKVLDDVAHYAFSREYITAVKKILIATKDETWSQASLLQFVAYINRSESGFALLKNRAHWFAAQVNSHPTLASSVIEMYAMKGLRDDILTLIALLNILPANTEMLKNAMTPKALVGSKQNGNNKEYKKTLILTDISTSSSAFKNLVQSKEIHIYNPSPTSVIDTDGDDDVNVFDSYTFNDRQEYIRELSSKSETVAAILARNFVKDMKSERLSEMFNVLYEAIYITLRVRLVGCFRKFEMQRHWQGLCDDDYDDVMIIASNDAFASDMVEVVTQSKFHKCSRMMALPSSLRDLPKYFDAFDPYYVSADHSTNKEASADDPDMSEVLEGVYDSVVPSYRAQEADSAGIFIVRLASKTVPGTVVPVIEESIRQQDNYLLEIQTTKDSDPGFTFDSGPTQRQHSSTVPHVVSLQLKEEARALSRQYTDVIQQWFLENKAFASKVIRENLGEDYINTIFKIGIGFDLSSMTYLMTLYKNFEVIMDSVQSFQVTVCPGRSVEAYLAQSMANSRGQISMDIMNAWMSDKSTYATPRGDIVTAIDHWSFELLRDHFLIQEESIKKMGTPRYDGIYQRAANEDTSVLRTKYNLPQDTPIVCFATQPMDMGLNLDILSAILKARDSGLNIHTIVKLHPREEEGRVAQYLEFIASLPKDVQDTVRLFKKENIIDTLICSDLVVTVFSNVATEANLCRKPTILCKFEGVAVPIPMDKMHLGRPVHSPGELTEFVAKAFTDKSEMQKYHDLIDKFLTLNSHLKTDETSKDIFEALQDKDLIGMGAKRPLAPSLN